MKKLIISIVFLISIIGISQNNPAYKLVKVYFKDGKTLNGVGKIGHNFLKYKTHGESKNILKYSPEDIYGFDLLLNRKIVKYRYRFIKEKDNKLILLVLAIQGKVNLYINNTYLNSIYKNNIELGYKFYVGRENDSTVTYLSTNQGSLMGIEPTLEFFKDCPSLYSKIKSRRIRISEMDEIVEYYNSNCNTE